MSLVAEETGEMKTMDALEAEIIRFALQFYRGRMSEVSRRLGIGRSTLYRKLKDLGLAEEDKVDEAAA
jgi:DNA-binding NtrC family response regulator